MANKPTCEELEQKIWNLKQQIAELNKTQNTLQDNKKIFRLLSEGEFNRTNDTLITLFNSLPGIINVVDTDYNVLDVSSRFIDAFSKLEEKQVIGQKCYRVHKKRDSICPECLVKRVYESGKPEIRFSTPEEETLTGWSFKVFASPIKDNKGNITGAVEFALDITDVKQAEKALQESQEKFRKLADFSPIAISILKGEQLLYVNSAWEELTGYNKEEALSLNPLMVIHPDMRELVRQRGLDRVQGKEVPARYEMKVITKSGDIKWVDFSATVIDYDGEPAILNVSNNITERKKAEQRLQASEERYRGLVNTMQDIVHSVSADGTILFIGPQVERYGFTVGELISQPFADFIHPEDRDVVLRDFQRTLSNAEKMITTFRINAKDGRVVWLEETGQAVRDATGNIFSISGILRDVTEKKLAEEALRDNERKLHAIFDHHYQLTGLIDTRGRLLAANRTALRFAGAEEAEVIGHYFWDGPWWDSSQRSELRNAVEQAVRGEFVRFETTHPTADGEIRNIDFSLSPVQDDDGNVIYIVPEGRDITKIRRTEKEKAKLQEQLKQAQKMEAIGTLAGGIAHDFNNILSVIIGNAEIAQYDLPEEDSMRHSMDQIVKASNRARDLVKQILAFSRQNKPELRPVRVSLIVKEAMKLLRSSLPSTIEIRQRIESENDSVMADPTQLHQIILNLCTNAQHAMRHGGGILDVRLTNIYLDSEAAADHPELAQGQFLKLNVGDTGHGMTPDIMEQIFDPYFSTKEKRCRHWIGIVSGSWNREEL